MTIAFGSWIIDPKQISRPVVLAAVILSGSLSYLFYKHLSQNTILQAQRSARTKDPNRPCRWRLDTSTSFQITLRDGRKLGFAEYGTPTGFPTFTIHGLPGCRLEAAVNDVMFSEAGARLIAVDRPGIGLSSVNPGSTVADHARDIQQLADHLGLAKYAVWGSSAGGPYALACAAVMPREKLKAVAVVCGLGAPDMVEWGSKLWVVLNTFRMLYGIFPALLRWIVSLDPATRLDIDDETRLVLLQRQITVTKTKHFRDAQVLNSSHLEDDLRLYSRGHREIYARGVDGLLQAALPLSKDWGFRIEDIRKNIPIHLWYGNLDQTAPVSHGKKIAASLGGQTELRIKDETHMSITANWKHEVLRHLLEAVEHTSISSTQ